VTPTPSQIRALRAMPFDLTMWGNEPHGGMPERLRMPTLYALRRMGLVKTQPTNMPSTIRWTITVAGKRTLNG